jgi:hypothetical protein
VCWQIGSILDGSFEFIRIITYWCIVSVYDVPVFILKLGLGGGSEFLVLEFVIFLKVLGVAGEGFDVVLFVFLLEGLYYNKR